MTSLRKDCDSRLKIFKKLSFRFLLVMLALVSVAAVYATRRFWREQLANVESVEQQQRLLEDFLWSLLASSKFNSK